MKQFIKKTTLASMSIILSVLYCSGTTRYLPGSSSDQTSLFQSLIDQSVSGDIIVVQSGDHYFSGIINVHVNNITIRGDNGNILRKSGSISLDANSNGCTYDNLYIDGGMHPEPCVRVFGDGNRFVNCTFRNSDHSGILIHECNATIVENCSAFYNTIVGVSQWAHTNGIIRNNNIYQNGGEGITIDGQSHNCEVYGNTLTSNNCQGRGVGGIGLDQVNNASIHNNTIQNTCGDGIKFQNNLCCGCDACSVYDNTIINNSGCAVMFRLTQNVTNFGWWGNTTYGNGGGELCQQGCCGVLTYASGGGGISNGTYLLTSVHSGKCMEVDAWSTANGANIQQWSCHGGNNMKWDVTSLGGGAYSLLNVNSGKAAEVGGWSTSNGGNIIQWTYHGGNNQRWILVDAGSGSYLLRNVHSNKCIDVDGWSTADGANLLQWDCHGGNNQKWIFTPVAKSDEIIEQPEQNTRIYPVPAEEMIVVNDLDDCNAIQIFNIYGQSVYSGRVTGSMMTIDISEYANGIYYMRMLMNDNHVQTHSFIKK